MPTRQELGKALVDCLVDVSLLLEKAHEVAIRQQDALTSNDAESIAVATKAQEEILRRVDETDQRAAAVAAQLAASAGLDPDTAGSDQVAEVAGPPYSMLLRREMARISDLAASVRQANEVNQHLLGNGMEVIACCLRLVAQDKGPNSYTNDATLEDSHVSVISLDSRA